MPQFEENKLVSSYYFNNRWHLDNIPFELPLHIISFINNIYMPIESTNYDKIYWNLTDNGIFSVNSMYRCLTTINTPTGKCLLNSYKWIWKLPVPPKISFFIWLLCHNRLPTAVYLSQVGITNSSTCPQCHQHNETIPHLFQTCANTILLWKSLRISPPTSTLVVPQNELMPWVYQLIHTPLPSTPYNIPSTIIIPFAL